MSELEPDFLWEDTCAKCVDGEIEPRHCQYYCEPNGCNSPIYQHHPESAVIHADDIMEAIRKIRQTAIDCRNTLPPPGKPFASDEKREKCLKGLIQINIDCQHRPFDLIGPEIIKHNGSSMFKALSTIEKRTNSRDEDCELSLDDAIAHANEVADNNNTPCGRQHRQLAEWLAELKDL